MKPIYLITAVHDSDEEDGRGGIDAFRIRLDRRTCRLVDGFRAAFHSAATTAATNRMPDLFEMRFNWDLPFEALTGALHGTAGSGVLDWIAARRNRRHSLNCDCDYVIGQMTLDAESEAVTATAHVVVNEDGILWGDGGTESARVPFEEFDRVLRKLSKPGGS